jgi:tRNA (guanine37-N1)-methyltransferase
MFRAEILTLFPGMVQGFLTASILGKAQERGLVAIRVSDIRDFAEGKHRVVDDTPYGGGAGMVMKPGPLVAALEAARTRLPDAQALLMSPRGPTLDQARVKSLAAHAPGLILACGRYEGIDERAVRCFDGELSLGDFVLTGGELAACAVVEAAARLHEGVLGNAESVSRESFEEGRLEHPHFTRPVEFRGQVVPAVLQSGDHARIDRWRRWQSLRLTQARRPDLLERYPLSSQDRALLALPETALEPES